MQDVKVHSLAVAESQYNKDHRRMDDKSLQREISNYDTRGLYVTHLPESLRLLRFFAKVYKPQTRLFSTKQTSFHYFFG